MLQSKLKAPKMCGGNLTDNVVIIICAFYTLSVPTIFCFNLKNDDTTITDVVENSANGEIALRAIIL